MTYLPLSLLLTMRASHMASQIIFTPECIFNYSVCSLILSICVSILSTQFTSLSFATSSAFIFFLPPMSSIFFKRMSCTDLSSVRGLLSVSVISLRFLCIFLRFGSVEIVLKAEETGTNHGSNRSRMTSNTYTMRTPSIVHNNLLQKSQYPTLKSTVRRQKSLGL
ncbi:hypothetical protein BDZ91DRAFT_710709 [Kalaharituber pfeilii]|nr:hypothetical protein BDZ91DRAFT_710709 [Kalaharituber pfeilii]